MVMIVIVIVIVVVVMIVIVIFIMGIQEPTPKYSVVGGGLCGSSIHETFQSMDCHVCRASSLNTCNHCLLWLKFDSVIS